MKPEKKSKEKLSYTRSVAKIIEFQVLQETREAKDIQKPETLFPLVIGMLGDLASMINENIINSDIQEKQEEELTFVANFFDSYKNAKVTPELDHYLLLIGSATYYLCNLPGSTKVLIEKIPNDENSKIDNLDAEELEKVLFWLLDNNYSENLSPISSIYEKQTTPLTSSICNYFNAGTDEENILSCCDKLRKKAYKRGSPRDLLFADIICAITRKKLQNSCWKNLPIYTDLDISKWEHSIKKNNFIKELWPAQHILGKNDVYKGQSAVIQMPTSAGKTKSIEIIIRSAFLSDRTNLAVIVAPFRALCHEIKHDLLKAFHREQNIEIDEISDAFENLMQSFLTGNQSKKHIIILTPEKLYYLLSQDTSIINDIELVIFDEGHQFDNGSRGITYELLLTELKELLPETTQRVLISAVLPNAQEIAEWLSPDSKVVTGNKLLPTQRSIGFVKWKNGKNGEIQYVHHDNPEKNEYVVPNIISASNLKKLGRETTMRNFPESDGGSIALYLGLKMVKQDSVAIFCGSKLLVTSLLKKVLDLAKRKTYPEWPKNYSNEKEIEKIITLCKRNLGDDAIITKCAAIGVFPHHANIPYGVRRAIEYGMHDKLIRFVICTSTLAQGVNLPIRYLFILNNYQGENLIKARDFHNLIGRVGRAGMFTEGSIIFTNPEIYGKKRQEWRNSINLLNPKSSENCTSTICEIFEPIQISDDVQIEPFELVNLYYSQENEKNQKIEEYSNIANVTFQINERLHLISKIENFLMMFGERLSIETAENLAKSTLAYHLAEEHRNEILTLFQKICEHILNEIVDTSLLPVFAKTLHGLNDSLEIQDWIANNKENFFSCSSSDEIFECLWNLFSKHIKNANFEKYPDKKNLKKTISKWLSGNSYQELYLLLKGDRIKIGTKFVTIEHVVDILENGMSYDGTLLINAITELVRLQVDERIATSISLLLLFQKQLKYGLPNIEAIILYEMGFSDRVVAQELAQLLLNTNDKHEMKRNILLKEKKVKNILDQYPSFYMDVFDRIMGR